jgi:diguanylate cyclase (GGDEF)-like protein
MTEALEERERRIQYQASHDPTTGLPNRFAIERAVERHAGGGKAAALLTIDITRVPVIVRTLGHAVCDRVLRDAGARLSRRCGESLLAQISDREFALWLPDGGNDAAIGTALRLIEELRAPYQDAEIAIDLGAVAGIALHPEHGRDAATLLRHAEIALFGARAAGDAIGVYAAANDPHRPERLSLMAELRAALDRNQLVLRYQPKLHIASGRVDAAEALVRWPRPGLEAVAPDSFIGLAEETGNIRQLTRWVLATGIAQARHWQDRGLDLRLSLNLSARDLGDVTLPQRIDELLALQRVAPRQIVLEITESAVMADPDGAIRVLQQLAERGLELAIDDFGVGHSSLAYLRRLPVREIKIDRSFVQRLHEVAADRAIVQTIIELGHRLGYRVCAEGVELQGELDCLTQFGCDYVQGYLIARPLEVAEFETFVDATDERRRQVARAPA